MNAAAKTHRRLLGLFSFGGAGVLLFILVLPAALNSPLAKIIESARIASATRVRVQEVGGWMAVQEACLNFVANARMSNDYRGIYFLGGKRLSTNSLPQTLETVQPMFVRTELDDNGILILMVEISAGQRRTGSYRAPYYAIWVACTNDPLYTPTFARGASHTIARKGSAVFEVR